MTGEAADIQITGVKPVDVCTAAEAALAHFGIPGCIGLYDTFTHIDVRAQRYRFTKLNANGGKERAVPGWASTTQQRPVLRQGMRGEDVRTLQTRLNELDKVGLNVDGTFGLLTLGAVKQFQASRGLLMDGIVGPLTWNALDAQTTHTALTDDDIRQIAAVAVNIIVSNEGRYDTVVKSDNGKALSIGKMGWHAGRALGLLKTICTVNQDKARSLLGSELHREITGDSAKWDTRVATDAEAVAIKAILGTAHGKAAQDSLALSDVTAYVRKGVSYGLTDAGALIYFADGVNQYGTNSALWRTIAHNALKTTGDVTAMFDATAPVIGTTYKSRRERTYRVVLGLPK
jgi:hypothetical protein